MEDKTTEAGLVPVLELAVAAYADACTAARAWGEGPSRKTAALLGRQHAQDIETLRDAAIHQAAVEPWAAVMARDLIGVCIAIVERGTRVFERCEWDEDEDGMPYVAHLHRHSVVDKTGEAAFHAAAALRVMAEAIERSLDVDAALARYGVHAR